MHNPMALKAMRKKVENKMEKIQIAEVETFPTLLLFFNFIDNISGLHY